MTRTTFLLAGLLLATGCDDSTSSAETFTLYRNSFLDRSIRVHWGTFDADESDPSYNRNNCEMAARLLNANLGASAEKEGKPPHPGLGFWCEPGSYSETGSVPATFTASFPTDV